MTMLTIEQLSYLLKFALQKMKQPGVRKIFIFFFLMLGSYVCHNHEFCFLLWVMNLAYFIILYMTASVLSATCLVQTDQFRLYILFWSGFKM